MSSKEAYKQKIEAEYAIAMAKLATWKANAKNVSADVRLDYESLIADVEKFAHIAKDKIAELGNAGENAWSNLTVGIDHAFTTLGNSIKHISSKIKE